MKRFNQYKSGRRSFRGLDRRDSEIAKEIGALSGNDLQSSLQITLSKYREFVQEAEASESDSDNEWD